MKSKLRFISFMFCLYSWQLLTPVLAQSQHKKSGNPSLVSIIKELEKSGSYSFSYNKRKLEHIQVPDYPWGDMKTMDAIKALEQIAPLRFLVIGKSIAVSIFEEGENRQNSIEKGFKVIRIQGNVLEEGTLSPVVGATVWIPSLKKGIYTDEQGRFSLDIPENVAPISISCIGYKRQSIPIGGKHQLEIILVPDESFLEEVLVIGYGVQSKRDVSTSIATINGKDLSYQPVGGFDQSLVGKASGVQIMQTSGAPGAGLSFRIRGLASITAGNDPLFVVDGIPLSNETKFATINTADRFQDNPLNVLTSINPQDIASVEILKDASASAIYGSRGSNGVVLISTKTGSEQGSTIEYHGFGGIQSVARKIDMLNAYEYAQLNFEGRNNTYLDRNPNGKPDDPNSLRPILAAQIPPEILPYLHGEEGLIDTDWQDAIFRNAYVQSHTLSLSENNNGLKYYISANYFDQEGVVLGSGLKRYAGRINFEYQGGRLDLRLNLNPSFVRHDLINSEGPYFDDAVTGSALHMPPIWPVYNQDGSYNFGGNAWGYSVNGVLNPVALAELVQDNLNHTRLMGRLSLGLTLGASWTYKLGLAADVNYFRRNYFRPSSLEIRDRKGTTVPTASTKTEFFENGLLEQTLEYNTHTGGHCIQAVVGTSAQQETRNRQNLVAGDFPNDLVQTLNAGQVVQGGTDMEKWTLLSLLGRMQYNFEEKYYASTAFRADGSSRFGKGNKWGLFPSFSIAWRLNAESWFPEWSWIEDLKIRSSLGRTGNFQIPNYGSFGLLSYDNYILGDEAQVAGVSPETLANGDLRWEKSSMWDIGLEITLFNEKVIAEIDYYSSNTSDLLLFVPVPRSSGFVQELTNIGKVNNRGIEASLTLQGGDLQKSWQIQANISSNTNTVKALGPSGEPIIVSGGVSSAQFITQIGMPIGSYYTLISDGVFKNADELEAYPHLLNTQPGDMKFRDVNGDGKIEFGSDRGVVGSYFPAYTFGISGNFRLSGWSLSVDLQGVQGHEILNLFRRYIYNMEGNMNMMQGALNRWQSEEMPGDGKHVRANRLHTGSNGEISTWHIEDASYVRVRNIMLSYSFSEISCRKAGLKRIQLYTSVQNPFTFTRYLGYNPEVNARPDSALSPGEDYASYPLAKVFALGVFLGL